MQKIRLPSNSAEPDGIWKPRDYQQPAWDYLIGGGKRLIEIDHRRAGKDELCLAWSAVAMHNRVGTYWHMLPEAAQARKAIWEAVDPHRGQRRIDLAFPESIRETTRNQEMFIRFKNGSTWQVVGSDNFDSLVGTPPVGLVFSEFALANPYAWSYLRPILLENGGWAAFITTPRGRNHAYALYKMALDPGNEWLAVMNKADETSVFTPEQLATELEEYIALYGRRMGTAMYQQEYLCSWEAAIPGAYYAEELNDLERDGRLTAVPWDKSQPVHTSHDLGLNDESVTFFWQVVGAQWRMIDVEYYRGTGLIEQVALMKKKPYIYGDHAYPHDLKVRDLGTAQSREKLVKGLGIYPHICPMHKVLEGIDAFRRIIPRLWIDREKCGEAFEILKSYRCEWDDKNKVLKKNPLHDFSSNFADSCRYRAMTPINDGKWSDVDYSELDRAAGWGH